MFKVGYIPDSRPMGKCRHNILKLNIKKKIKKNRCALEKNSKSLDILWKVSYHLPHDYLVAIPLL